MSSPPAIKISTNTNVFKNVTRLERGASLKAADAGDGRFREAQSARKSTFRGWRGWPSRHWPIGCGRKACSPRMSNDLIRLY